MDCMKKIRAIFSSWVGRENHFKKIATLGSTRIIQLPNGEYHVLGGTPEDRFLLHQYISLNLQDFRISFANKRKVEKLSLLLKTLANSD
jgi:hypothetical protein